jgi:hypothetical protein
MPCPSHPLWLGNYNYIRQRIVLMKLMELSPTFYYFIPLGSKCWQDVVLTLIADRKEKLITLLKPSLLRMQKRYSDYTFPCTSPMSTFHSGHYRAVGVVTCWRHCSNLFIHLTGMLQEAQTGNISRI